MWLDCTLRDGGYYNNWDFDQALIQEYLDAMAGCGVDRVEIGFRSKNKAGFRGATAYTSDSFLSSLELPEDLHIGVMINVAEVVGAPDEVISSMEALLPAQSRELISFVRLATHIEEYEAAAVASRWLKEQGYEVGVNIMQVSEATESQIALICEQLDPLCVDVLYLADSLGNLTPNSFQNIFGLFQESWFGDMGIHAHDNAGLALANTLSAMDSGVRWVDSTVAGMGRGAGNTKTELLAGHILGSQRKAPKTSLLGNLISRYFDPLRIQDGWGANFYYARAAKLGIHPSFIQELLASKSYSPIEIEAAIEKLGSVDSKRYSLDALNDVSEWIQASSSPASTWNQESMFANKDVLIIGAGPSAEQHKIAIKQFIRDSSPVVLVANLGRAWSDIPVDAHVACHPLRLAADGKEFAKLGRKIIAPSAFLSQDVVDFMQKNLLLCDIGIDTQSPEIQVGPGMIGLPNPLVLPFSLLVCLSGGSRRIFLAGFDGYPAGDPRLSIEQGLLDRISELAFDGDFIAVTPTRFNMPRTSIYALGIS
jgi:4-hydroxy 2-oxovalerate aldolase